MKKIKILTIILGIVLVTMVAFFGIYVQVQNRMENKVKDYSYAMDLKGARNIKLTVDTTTNTVIKDSEGNDVTDESSELSDEELAEKGYTKEETKKNQDEVLNVDNYKKTKEIIEKRLKELGVNNYITKLDEKTGDILIEIPENNSTDSVISNLGTTGKFEIIDSSTKEVLMDNNDIKRARVMYGSNSTSSSYGTSVYLEIEFNKEGAEKLENISKTYVQTNSTNQTNSTSTSDSESTDNNSEIKEITMKVDDEEIMTTSFDETIETGKLQLSLGTATTDSSTLQGYIAQASSMAIVLNNGNMPVAYTVNQNEYILSDITQNEINIIVYTILAIMLIGLIILIVRYKSKGLINAFSFIGLAALLLLLLRYTNVVISIESIFGIAIVLILNYIFINKLLAKLRKEENVDKTKLNISSKETYKEFFIRMMPILITVITFCFINWEPISSFGMVMFWGIALIAIYNVAITNLLMKVMISKGGKSKNEK